MGNGKKDVAPCGHPGEYVIGGFIQCSAGCDAIPQYIELEDTEPIWKREFVTPTCPHTKTYTGTVHGHTVQKYRWCYHCGKLLGRV